MDEKGRKKVIKRPPFRVSLAPIQLLTVEQLPRAFSNWRRYFPKKAAPQRPNNQEEENTQPPQQFGPLNNPVPEDAEQAQNLDTTQPDPQEELENPLEESFEINEDPQKLDSTQPDPQEQLDNPLGESFEIDDLDSTQPDLPNFLIRELENPLQEDSFDIASHSENEDEFEEEECLTASTRNRSSSFDPSPSRYNFRSDRFQGSYNETDLSRRSVGYTPTSIGRTPSSKYTSSSYLSSTTPRRPTSMSVLTERTNLFQTPTGKDQRLSILPPRSPTGLSQYTLDRITPSRYSSASSDYKTKPLLSPSIRNGDDVRKMLRRRILLEEREEDEMLNTPQEEFKVEVVFTPDRNPPRSILKKASSLPSRKKVSFRRRSNSIGDSPFVRPGTNDENLEYKRKY